MPSVRLDGMLREFVPQLNLTSSSRSLLELLEDLEGRYPRLRFRLRDETGELRRFVRVFVNGRSVETEPGLRVPLGASDKVDILHSIQGG